MINKTLPCNELVQIARTICIGLGVVNAVLALTLARELRDRLLVYVGLDMLIAGTEWQQLNTHAPFLVWRLPLATLLIIVSAFTLRRYMSGRLR